MFCPRCGAENDEANRFCVNCGATLAGKPERPGKTPVADDSPGHRLGELIGTSRRARIITGLTVLALAIAVVAFLVLRSDESGEDSVAQDAYLRQLDHQCVQEKARLSELEAETLQQAPPDFGSFVNLLVRDVTEWHANVQASPPPPEHVEGVRGLEGALLEILIEAGRLGTSVREGSQADIIRTAKRVDAATAEVDPALEYLGLDRCADLVVKPG